MISVTDIDAGDAENFLVTLSVADGVLALVSRDGVVVNGRGTTCRASDFDRTVDQHRCSPGQGRSLLSKGRLPRNDDRNRELVRSR